MPVVAYFITFSTYGTWLHGREAGSVDRHHNAYGSPVLAADAERERQCQARMKEPPYTLDAVRRDVVLQTIKEVAQHRRWQLWAVHVRSNHVHVVVTADANPEKVMSDFKSWSSRRLKEQHDGPEDRTRWTQHGSTRHLMKDVDLLAAVIYTVREQGEAMALWYDPSLTLELEAEATDSERDTGAGSVSDGLGVR